MQQSDNTVREIADHIEAILRLIGEDPTRDGLLKTPMRYAKALQYLTSGYNASGTDTLRQAVFEHEGSQLVTVRDIEFYSLCEHHVLPFFGNVSIGYVPDGKIVGLSKVARMVDVYAHRLQVQERFTAQLADAMRDAIDAKGVIVACHAQHLCMKMRGIEKQDTDTLTVHYNGIFNDNEALRREFFSLLQLR